MPNDLWNITETIDDDGDSDPLIDIVLQRTVTAADWDRFLFYSQRVRSFITDR
ncbi:hypothetical protein B0H17DRAFT_1090140 [Mycena rosella]|uniref:Uncharacterized protein n=1 Tax=Mycena rosella TaxID=1033263 RepID=A0AAD7CVN2_MYCRO|nr:hypothetical protein B0H17DRAFT_1090140 [Mycena rosella]